MANKKTRRQSEAPQPRRRRRSTEEIVNLIIEAACDEFERYGYEKAKTARIAKKAGVAEALIFTNFGTKAELFHDAIFEPLDRHFVDFCAAHPVKEGDVKKWRKDTRLYIIELQRFIARHSGMLMSLVAAQMYASDDVFGVSKIEGLDHYFSKTAAMAMKNLAGKPKIHPNLLSRISFATLLACVIFSDWLFPKDSATETDIADSIASFVMEGLSANATSHAWLNAERRTRACASMNASAPAKKQRQHRPKSRSGRKIVP